VKQKLCWFSADPEVVMHGDELLSNEDQSILTTVKSAGYGHTVGRTIFSAYLPIAHADEENFIVDVATRRYPALRHDQPLYDPKGVRIRA
jgi:glycine cleavage system aminomethyltransferase T